MTAEKDAASRRGCVVPKRHPGDAAVCATSCWQERIGKGHCPAEPLPDAEKDAPVWCAVCNVSSEGGTYLAFITEHARHDAPTVLDLDDPYFHGQTLPDALSDYAHVHSATGVCVKNIHGPFCILPPARSAS